MPTVSRLPREAQVLATVEPAPRVAKPKAASRLGGQSKMFLVDSTGALVHATQWWLN